MGLSGGCDTGVWSWDRIVSVCCGEAIVIRSSNEGTNHYECVKCGNACDIKQQEVTE